MYSPFKSFITVISLFSSLTMVSHDSFAAVERTYTIAVLDLEANGVSTIEAKGLSEKIRTRIAWLVNNATYKNNPVTDKYSVVERSQMDKIFDQFNIQNTICTDVSCAIEFGKMLQADRIIIGSVNLLGRTFNVTTRMIDIESAMALSVSEVDYRGSIDGLLGARIQDVADELLLGRRYDDWMNSEAISVSGSPPDALVTVNGKKVGSTPVHNTMVPAGTLSLRIRKQGYEDYHERIPVKKGAPLELEYTLWPKTRKRAIIKSLYFPGSGQRYAEYRGKGYLISLVQLATIAGLAETTMMSMDARNEYDDAKDAYHAAKSQYDYDRTYKIVEEKYDDAKQAQKLQLISAGAAAAVYLYNVIDAALREPKREDRFGEKSLRIEPRITKDYSSITVSLRF